MYLKSLSSDLLCILFQVTNVELEEVLSQGAYMLLYCRYLFVYMYVCLHVIQIMTVRTFFLFFFLDELVASYVIQITETLTWGRRK